ncbi:hypothetical protein [Streptomyces thermolilacinus]|uniref:hypothetical protein n=1 Tax=Streptomyces thermolilacinus TaxID=285540 RepID=UPI001F30F71C|nr:hypothetical protein [Streptomyces thermolilacinus]
MLAAACSGGSEAEVEVRDSAAVKADTKKVSSRVLEMLALEGKVTETGAMTMRCSGFDADEKVYRARHPWSVYDASFADMRAAFDRLRGELPKNGWKIVKDGPDGTAGKSPQIVAESEGGDFAVDARLHEENRAQNAPALLTVTVESACYKGSGTS